MDPFSITASTIAVLQAASAASRRSTITSISVTLCQMITAFRNADAKVSALCSEVSTLVRYLEAVDRTLKKSQEQPLSLASIDEDLWRQSALSLGDCKTTLSELKNFIDRIKAVARSDGFFRRAKIAVDLTIYGSDILAFQEKIHKSNLALQTILSAITVSLSLRTNVAQDTIIFELGRLKQTIEQSLHVSLRHTDGLFHTLADPSDARVTHNLRNLARVAQTFHSSASSTASTIHGGNGTQWNILSDTAMSVRGGLGLTIDKRHQIDRYFKSMRRATKPKSLMRHTSSAAASMAPLPEPAASAGEADSNASEVGDENDDGDGEAEVELLFLNGLEGLAKDHMLNQDFAKAETILVKAIQRHTGSSSAEVDLKKLQIQLSICYFFQHKWRLAEPLILNIAKSRVNLDTVLCNLLHALAVAHLTEYSFEKSIALCKQALQGKKRFKHIRRGAHVTFYNETLGLLATIYEMKGDHDEAEALRRHIPIGFSYEHPRNALDFIVKHPDLSQKVFGEKITLDIDCKSLRPLQRKLTVVAELPVPKATILIQEGASKSNRQHLTNPARLFKPATKKPLQTLRSRIDLYKKYDMDTAKEVVLNSPTRSIPSSASYSSDERSVKNSTSSNSGSSTFSRPEPTLKRSFTRNIARLFGTVRVRSQVSLDDFIMRHTPQKDLQKDCISSPVRRKLGKVLWSKSEPHLFSLRKSKRRLLRKRTSYVTGGHAMLDKTPNGGWDGGNLVETDYTSRSAETGRSRFRYGVDSWLGMSSDTSFHELPVSPVVRRSSFKYTPESVTPENDEFADNIEETVFNNTRVELVKFPTLKRPNLKRPNLNLKPLIIPGPPGKCQGDIPLVAHYPQMISTSSPPKMPESRKAQPEGSIVPGSVSAQKNRRSRPKHPATPPNKFSSAKTMAKVLYDFTSQAENELDIKENEIIHVIRRASKGWLLVDKGGKQGFVPASYVDTNSIIPAPAESSINAQEVTNIVKQAPKCLSQRKFNPDCDPKDNEDIVRDEPHGLDLYSASDIYSASPRKKKRFSWEYNWEEDIIDSIALEEPASDLVLPEAVSSTNNQCSNQSVPKARSRAKITTPPSTSSSQDKGTETPRYQLVDDGPPEGVPVLQRPEQSTHTGSDRNDSSYQKTSPCQDATLRRKTPLTRSNPATPSGPVLKYDSFTRDLILIQDGRPLTPTASLLDLLLLQLSGGLSVSNTERGHKVPAVRHGSIEIETQTEAGSQDAVDKRKWRSKPRVVEGEDRSNSDTPSGDLKSRSTTLRIDTVHLQDAESFVKEISMLHRPHPLKGRGAHSAVRQVIEPHHFFPFKSDP
ncbi:hypothetical protein BP6252_14121 [Coleophoma cylindrospora]|uniref:SH3 domain-containing protein n=1 Tax=Coleophoma cylindrospora TaxID=1849047 RepID=A0A3D8Q3T9_9HELO|nr:hypothetical protein BP6252_14121 [Coleophoma cylindrospora]